MSKEIHEKVKVYLDLLDALKDGPKQPKDLISELDLAESTFYHVVKRLQDWDKIVKEEGKYRLAVGKITSRVFGVYDYDPKTKELSFVVKPTERIYAGHPVVHALHQTYPEDGNRASIEIVLRMSNKTQDEVIGIRRAVLVCKDESCPLYTELTDKEEGEPFHARLQAQDTLNKTLTASFNSNVDGEPQNGEYVVTDKDALIELHGMDDEVIEKIPVLIRFIKGKIDAELVNL